MFRVLTFTPMIIAGGESDHGVMKGRVEEPRTVRDFLIISGKGSCQRLHRTFRMLCRKHNTTCAEIASKCSTIPLGSVLDFGSLSRKSLEEQVQKVVMDALVTYVVTKNPQTLADHFESKLENQETFLQALWSQRARESGETGIRSMLIVTWTLSEALIKIGFKTQKLHH